MSEAAKELSWFRFFSLAEIGELDLGFSLPALAIAEPLDPPKRCETYDGSLASAWAMAGCHHFPPKIEIAHDYFSSERSKSPRLCPRRVLLHELSHIAGNGPHDLMFAMTLSVIFHRHHRRNRAELFKLHEYDVHEACGEKEGAPAFIEFCDYVGSKFADHDKSILQLLPDMRLGLHNMYYYQNQQAPPPVLHPRRRGFFWKFFD